MTEPTLLGITASEAVGKAVLTREGDMIVDSISEDGSTATLVAKYGGAIVDAKEGWDITCPTDGPFVIAFLTIPNPMSRAPRCGQPVIVKRKCDGRMVQVYWSALRDAWLIGSDSMFGETDIQLGIGEDDLEGWLSCHGAKYNPALMGGPEVGSE